MEQVYTQLQTRTKDLPDERMTTMERSLAHLVAQGKVAPLEAEKWADDKNVFLDEMKRAASGPLDASGRIARNAPDPTDPQAPGQSPPPPPAE